MEFLSRQFNSTQGAVNLVLQSPDSVTHGYDASGTAGFEVQRLPFRPDQQFHEYRFDWTKDRVAFYVDGSYLHEITHNVPTEGGAIFFNHWSNGDASWSAGPPAADTVMTISYVKAYFNSTDTARSQNAYRNRCPKFDPSKICAIPSQDGPPDAKNLQSYFFSKQKDMTPGQTVYQGDAGMLGVFPLAVPWVVALLGVLLTW
jgi:beta-glucanase (GH16 family)